MRCIGEAVITVKQKLRTRARVDTEGKRVKPFKASSGRPPDVADVGPDLRRVVRPVAAEGNRNERNGNQGLGLSHFSKLPTG
jgi:hypothetical protein